LYGTAGNVFAVNTNGTGFRTLYSFSTNSYGARGQLILSDNTLYGTSDDGPNGTIFAVNTDGTGFRTLYSFSATTITNSFGAYTNSDGAYPARGDNLVLSGNTLFGQTLSGGLLGYGTIFAVITNGTSFTNLHNMDPLGADFNGSDVDAERFVSNNTWYGTQYGSTNNILFSRSLSVGQPQLTFTPSATNLILTWPANFSGFTLQSSTNLGSSTEWTTNSLSPVIVNGQNTVTNPISSTQQFFRLVQ
jgi:hypothetical protein